MAIHRKNALLHLKLWEKGMEHMGPRVNIKEPKIVISRPGLDLLLDSGGFHYAVCQGGVVNYIQCSKCRLWVHKKCSCVRGKFGLG